MVALHNGPWLVRMVKHVTKSICAIGIAVITIRLGLSVTNDITQGSTIVDLKSYWPQRKLLAQTFFAGIHIYSDKNRYIVQ